MRLLLAILAVAAQAAAGNWAVFNVNPRNAIVTIDSAAVHNVRDGLLQVMLPFGTHRYKCESPYFEQECGEFEVTDTTKSVKWIDLKPLFAYLVVTNPIPGSYIYVDGEKVGKTISENCRISEGMHRISIVKGDECWYDSTFILSKGEKKTIAIDSVGLKPEPLASVTGLVIPEADDSAPAEILTEEEATVRMKTECGRLSIHTPVPGATILVNGKVSGTTPAVINDLYPGVKYRITLRMEGFRETSRIIEVPRGDMLDLEIKMKKR